MRTKGSTGKALLCAAGFMFLLQVFWGGAGVGNAAEGKPELLAFLGKDPGAAQASDFELKDTNGSGHRLSSYKGNRPVLLYFWATWCPACLAVKPQVAGMRKDVPESELEILGINVGGVDTPERMKKYMAGHPAPYPNLYDEGGEVTKTYRVQGIPLFILVDRDGKVAYRSNTMPPDIKQLIRQSR